jgi:acetyl-CoA C-acetyltransferase
MLKEVVIVAGARTAIGDYMGTLQPLKGHDLGTLALKGVMDRAGIDPGANGSVEPRIMGMGVVPAVHKALEYANLKMEDIDYWELNEAFAAQFLGCNRELKIPLDKVNAHGSGIPLGHPVGMTGARIIMAAVNELKRRGGRYACSSMCASGGPAGAFIVENIC